MNNFRKKILMILTLLILCISSIISQSISFNISKGNYNSISFYDEYGNIKEYSSINNFIAEKTILKTTDSSVSISYDYGELTISENSIVVINPNLQKPIIYLIDGQVTLETNSLIKLDYEIITPVSKYEFKSPAKINVISNEELEYGIFYHGSGTSYNALTNQTIYLNSAQLIDMGFVEKITLDIPENYLNSNIDIEKDEEIVDLIKTEYLNKEKQLIAENKIKSEKLRKEFLNSSYLLDIKPIQKSNNFDRLTKINIIVSGNGQGNISSFDLPSFSGIINAAKDEAENILLIDAGNTLRGSTFVNFDKGKTATKILDMVGYDIFVPGAIDFSNGINRLQNLDNISNVNFISTNALNNDSLFYFDPFGLYLFDNFKIAVLGLSNPSDITSLMEIDLTNKVILDNAQKAIDEANKIADYVVLVTNLNYEKYNTNYILNNIIGLDLIIDGNTNDASLLNVQNTPIIKTGVGYSEIQNYKLNVKNDKVISTNYAKVYSSNINKDNNRLVNSLNLKDFEKDINLQNYLSLINIPTNLSKFLISPMFKNAPLIVEKLKEESNLETTLDKPSFVSKKSSEQEIDSIESPKFKPVTYEKVEKNVITPPTFKAIDYKETPEDVINTPTFKAVDYDEIKEEKQIIATPNFKPVEYYIEQIINAPSFKSQPYTIEEIVKIEDIKIDKKSIENENVIINAPSAPNFEPISYKVRKQEVIDKEPLVEKEDVEKNSSKDETEDKKKPTIYSNEDSEIKTHVGINSQINAYVDFKDSSLTNNDYYGSAILYPYILRGGFSFAIKLCGELDNSYNISTPLYPLPSSTSDIIDYSLDIIDHFKLYTPSDKLNIDINRNNFSKDIDSAILYDEFGNSDLQLKTKLSGKNSTLKFYISDLNLLKPLNDVTNETAYLNYEYNSIDLFKLKFGAIAIGNSSALNIYPSINFDLIPLNNKDITIKFNLGSTLYLNALPTLDFSTIIDQTNPTLIPNYLANTSLDIISNSLSLSIKANYLVSEDSTKFSTNLIHKETYQNNVINNVDTNTLTLLTIFKIDNENIDLDVKYSIPFDMSNYSFDNDLIDLNLALDYGAFNFGGYYLQNNFISHLNNISNIKGFFINNDTEFGGYFKYSFDNLSLKTSLKIPSTSIIPMQLGILINYNIEL